MTVVSDFLIANDFTAFDDNALIAEFQREMTAGLAGEKSSSLAMIPSFINLPKTMPRNKKVAVLDAGGTNLRAAIVAFDAAGKPAIENIVKTKIPGAKTTVSANDFYTQLTDLLLSVMPEEITDLGFCFSYPAKITTARDARLLYWTKEIKAPEVVGQFVGAELKECLAERGRAVNIVVLNDTVATLLAGYSVMPDAESFIGFILGTGTNTAYLEKTAAIKKSIIAQRTGDEMIINVESGGFTKLPRSKFDLEFDATTQNVGAYLFEKAKSGVYVGGLALVVLKRAASANLFSPSASKILGGLTALENIDIDNFCAELPTELFSDWSASDQQMVRELVKPLYERSAYLAAANIAATILRCGKKNVCVNVDGSTYYKTKAVAFEKIVHEKLDKILSPHQIKYTLIKVDDSPVLGSAVAAFC